MVHLRILKILTFFLLFGHGLAQQIIPLVHNIMPPYSGDISFGYSIASEGLTALIGAPQANISGAVYVYQREENTPFWNPMSQIIVPTSTGSFDRFGYSVDISGNFALIGAPSQGVKGIQSGAAYVYQNINNYWVQVAILFASDAGPYDNFGTSVAIRGSYALVGAPHNTGDDSGAVYVFSKTPEGNWTQQTILKSPLLTKDHFGESLSLSVDGTTAIIGAHFSGTGSTYVYRLTGSDWSGEAQLTGSDNDLNFGKDVAVFLDTAVVTADSGGGSVYVFVRTGGIWVRDDLVRGIGVPFGLSVALLNDSVMLVSSGSNLLPGQVYYFVRSSSNWGLSSTIVSETGYPGDGFGVPLALNQNIILTASKSHTPNGTEQYIVYSGFVNCPNSNISAPHCLSVPNNWTCPAVYYDDHSYCNCSCGVVDPDCVGTQICPPTGWTCPPSYWNDQLCDCGCGLTPDIDCSSNPICHRPPPSWQCGPAFWGDGICDCYCGPVPDPDCIRERNGCPPRNWTCSFSDYNDDICTCLCGVPDPVCKAGACPVIWSCSRILWNDGKCNCGCGSRDVFDCADGECPNDPITSGSVTTSSATTAAIVVPIVIFILIISSVIGYYFFLATKSPSKGVEAQPLSQLVIDRRPTLHNTSFRRLIEVPKSGLKSVSKKLQKIPTRFKYSLGNPANRGTYGGVSTGKPETNTPEETLAQKVRERVVRAGTNTAEKLKEVTRRFKGRITKPNFLGNPDEEVRTDNSETAKGSGDVGTSDPPTTEETVSAPVLTTVNGVSTAPPPPESGWDVPPPVDTPPPQPSNEPPEKE